MRSYKDEGNKIVIIDFFTRPGNVHWYIGINEDNSLFVQIDEYEFENNISHGVTYTNNIVIPYFSVKSIINYKKEFITQTIYGINRKLSITDDGYVVLEFAKDCKIFSAKLELVEDIFKQYIDNYLMLNVLHNKEEKHVCKLFNEDKELYSALKYGNAKKGE